MDLLQGVKEAAEEENQAPPAGMGGDFKMPSVEQLLEALDKMNGLTDENKEELRKSLLERAASGEQFIPPGLQAPMEATKSLSVELGMLLLFLAIIGLIFAFFGYKLYKSLMDRQRKQEEKKRQKQQKKKK